MAVGWYLRFWVLGSNRAENRCKDVDPLRSKWGAHTLTVKVRQAQSSLSSDELRQTCKDPSGQGLVAHLFKKRFVTHKNVQIVRTQLCRSPATRISRHESSIANLFDAENRCLVF
jgi:hypothetical protein